MKSTHLLRFFGSGLLAITLLSGCGSTDEGGSASVGAYYGTGFYDPWYYGHYHEDVDIIVTPPGDGNGAPRPSHPIAKPPASAQPMPRPSMPAPRPSFRR